MSEPQLRRAVAALRAGRAVRIGKIAVAALETATREYLELRDPDSRAPLLISGQRAAALKLGNARDAADPAMPVAIRRADGLDPEPALAIADPGQDLDRPPLGPFETAAPPPPEDAKAALTLARSAGLLPALWMVEASDSDPRVEAAAVNRAQAEAEVTQVARARLPLDGLPPTQIAVFRAEDDGEEHVALVIGAFGGEPPLVRLHSECLTGDVFGSLKCDCGPQLREALQIIAAAGGGLLLYLRQEGRGIGLANKIRAYALQDRGLDTVDSNQRLGFADDERDYGHAAAILRALGVRSVRLLTNNPAKVAGLKAAGIAVAERVAHQMAANPHNADYLATKRARSGHLPG